MNAHCFQHVPFENLGSIESCLLNRNWIINRTAFYENPQLPSLDQVDFLIIMGGPMSANDEDQYPWLVEEKRFIRQFIATGKPLLGICLGAQLIASALGERVYPNRCKEIGWFPVMNPKDNGNVYSFNENIEFFHWHGETFDLPPRAELLAETEACKHQAFLIGSAMGLQFHMETTEESLKNIVDNCREELISAEYVQSEKDILQKSVSLFEELNREMDRLLDYLLHPKG